MDNTLIHSPTKSLPPITEVTHSLLPQFTSHHYSIGYQPSKVFLNLHNYQGSHNLYSPHLESHSHGYIQPELVIKKPVSIIKENSQFPMADVILKPKNFFSTVSAQEKLPPFDSEQIQEIPDYTADHSTDQFQENQSTIFNHAYDHKSYESQSTEEDEENTIKDISGMEVDSVHENMIETLPVSLSDLNQQNPPKFESMFRKNAAAKSPIAATPKIFKKKKSSKKNNTRPRAKRWSESDDDKIAFLREYGNLKWHEVTEFINGRHTTQAVQMRYLRSLKRRNDTLTLDQRKKLAQVVEEDYQNRFKRISIAMGPAFTPLRIQKIFLQDVGLGDLLKPERIWTKEEIAAFIDAADGDFDNFKVPHFGEKMPPAALQHIEKYQSLEYDNLVKIYIGKD